METFSRVITPSASQWMVAKRALDPNVMMLRIRPQSAALHVRPQSAALHVRPQSAAPGRRPQSAALHVRPQSAAPGTRRQSATPREHFFEQLRKLDNNIHEAREARDNLDNRRPQIGRASNSRPQTALSTSSPYSIASWSQPRSQPNGMFSKPRERVTRKPRGPPVVLAEGRALKPVLWFPGDGAAAIIDRDMEAGTR